MISRIFYDFYKQFICFHGIFVRFLRNYVSFHDFFPCFSVLPHSPLVDSKDVCVITRDLEKGLKVDHEDSVNHYKDLLSEKGVEAASVMSLRELKVEYKPFEAKTALCHRHEIFLADVRIVRFLPKFLGKCFYKKKKFPVQVNLEAQNLKKEFDKVRSGPNKLKFGQKLGL